MIYIQFHDVSLTVQDANQLLYYYQEQEKNPTLTNELWRQLKDNKDMLQEAITLNSKLTFTAPYICEMMLRHFYELPKDIYQKLVAQVFDHPTVARTQTISTMISFLNLVLLNPHLELTAAQKVFAVKEAMNQPDGYTYIRHQHCAYDKTCFYLQRKDNPLQQEMQPVPSHGNDAFDIRYFLLKNSSFSKDERKELIFLAYQHQEYYEKTMLSWINNMIVENLKTYDLDRQYSLEEGIDLIQQQIADLPIEFKSRFQEEKHFLEEILDCRPFEIEMQKATKKTIRN